MSSLCVVPFSAPFVISTRRSRHTTLRDGRTEFYFHLWLPALILRLQQLGHLNVDGWVRVSYPREVLLHEVAARAPLSDPHAHVTDAKRTVHPSGRSGTHR